MRVAFLYNRSADDPANAAEDEDPSRSPVVAALKRLDHDVVPIACSLDLAQVQRQLQSVAPDVVFNRVESLGGSDSMMAAITLLLDAMRLPYTGNSTAALIGTASKTAAKRRLLQANLPTPRWISSDVEMLTASNPTNEDTDGPLRYIIKSDLEHASFEIDDASIVKFESISQIKQLVADREACAGRKYFAEEFIEGREFNISVMCDPPRVLPPAEIDFSAFPSDKARIVSHSAKWSVGSFEFENTPRRFDFIAHDHLLLRELTELTIQCWRVFGLTGYARVDYRCDSTGKPWILEINTNPCVAPDAGFAAALEHAGMGYDAGLKQILQAALARHGRAISTPESVPSDELPMRCNLERGGALATHA